MLDTKVRRSTLYIYIYVIYFVAAILDSITVIYCHLAKRLKFLRKLGPPHSPAAHESAGTAARRTPWPNPKAITVDVNLHAENGLHYIILPAAKHQLYHACFAIIFSCQHLSTYHTSFHSAGLSSCHFLHHRG